MAENILKTMTAQELNFELQQGAKFVVYQYCISVVLMTFKRPSKVMLVKHGESRVAKGLPYIVLSLLLGWWGIPWGPIFTIQALVVKFGGGKDITDGVLQPLHQQAATAATAAK